MVILFIRIVLSFDYVFIKAFYWFYAIFNPTKYFETGVLNPGAGFLRIFTVAFDRLF